MEASRPQLSWQAAALGAILLASCGHLLIKLGLNYAAPGVASSDLLVRIVRYLVQPEVSAGLVTYGMGTVLWIVAVSRKNISFLYPLTALNYVIVCLGGKFLFSESISTGRWVGIAVVVAGIAMLQLSALGDRI